MNTLIKFAIAATACAMLSACITTRSYVDPQFHRASYGDIKRLAQPDSVRIDARFERNGQAYPAADSQLHDIVERTLRATGVFIPSPESPDGAVVEVVANNIADISAARAKGFGTGLTFGAAGSVLPDYYDFTFMYRDASGKEHKSSYHHALYTTVGHATPPVTAPATTPALAFQKIAEDVTLNFVKDLQAEGVVAEH